MPVITMLPKLTVWYNTKCPVCNAGINWQQNRLLEAVRSGAIDFRDINLEPDVLAGRGIGVEAIRRKLHGVDDNQHVFVGADCAVEIWRRTPGDGWLAAIAGFPLIRPLARLVYNMFAAGLYRWNRARGHW